MTDYYGMLYGTGNRLQYPALERLFSPLPTLVTMILGRPVLVDVINETGYSQPVTYGTPGREPGDLLAEP